ncbi:MAG: hypothetical protein KBD31_04610 [Proteobacteria bacterium]|nr:hypothetical protein [Pseudomonadota bacterium]
MKELDAINLSPLCVDLDGTLIKEDVLFVSWKALFKKTPLKGLEAFLWFFKGRAYLKKKLANYSAIDPKTLSYNNDLLEFLKSYKSRDNNHLLILATAADYSFAKAVAEHLQIFDSIVASEGSLNLRAEFKAKRLSELFGEKNFSYVGNSFDDIKVWKNAKHAIGVNLSFKAKLFLKFENIIFYKILT